MLPFERCRQPKLFQQIHLNQVQSSVLHHILLTILRNIYMWLSDNTGVIIDFLIIENNNQADLQVCWTKPQMYFI